MPAERLFVAIAYPDALREELSRLAEPIRAVAWTRPEQIHLTLRFLGDVKAGRIGPVEDALAAIRVEPFVLPVGGLGVFPPRGQARVLWVGSGPGHPRLFQLRQRVDDALLRAGIALDARLFQPHATLARIQPGASPAAVEGLLRRHRAFEAAPIRVDAFGLYASELKPSGAVHTLRRAFPLGSPA